MTQGGNYSDAADDTGGTFKGSNVTRDEALEEATERVEEAAERLERAAERLEGQVAEASHDES